MDRTLRTLARSRPVLGICGGYQMLGTRIEDPNGIEGGTPGSYRALGLLPVVTRFDRRDKVTLPVTARAVGKSPLLQGLETRTLEGYEIRMGRPQLLPGARPALRVISPGPSREEGAVDPSGRILGTSIHGLLDHPEVRSAVLGAARRPRRARPRVTPVREVQDVWEENLDRLAHVVRRSIDMTEIHRLLEAS